MSDDENSRVAYPIICETLLPDFGFQDPVHGLESRSPSPVLPTFDPLPDPVFTDIWFVEKSVEKEDLGI